MTHIDKLLSVSSEPLARPPLAPLDFLKDYPLGYELIHMLESKNGFYAFASALHVFPHTRLSVEGLTLADWNSDSLWRNDYGDLAAGLLFFAEDVFQDQFCLSSHGVLRFNAETGGTKPIADSLEGWAELVLRDYAVETGYPVAKEWQLKNGPLQPGQRLIPKTPFLLGGGFSTENLWAGDAVEGMRFKADVAMQTRNLPNGTQVRMVIGKKPVN